MLRFSNISKTPFVLGWTRPLFTLCKSAVPTLCKQKHTDVILHETSIHGRYFSGKLILTFFLCVFSQSSLLHLLLSSKYLLFFHFICLDVPLFYLSSWNPADKEVPRLSGNAARRMLARWMSWILSSCGCRILESSQAQVVVLGGRVPPPPPSVFAAARLHETQNTGPAATKKRQSETPLVERVRSVVGVKKNPPGKVCHLGLTARLRRRKSIFLICRRAAHERHITILWAY